MSTPRNLHQRLQKMRLPELQAHYREVVGEATRSPNRTWLIRRIEEALAARERPQAKEKEQAPRKPSKGTKGGTKPPKKVERDEAPAPETSAPTVDEAPQDAHPAPVKSESHQNEAAESVSAATSTPPESAPTASASVEPASNEGPPAAKPPRGRFAAMTVEQLRAKYLEVVGRPTGSNDRGYLIWKIREAEKGRVPVGPRAPRRSEGEPSDMKVLPLRLEGQAVEQLDEAWRSRGIKSRTEFIRRALAHYLTHLGASDAAALFAADAVQA
jgi:hypothetical protein